NISSLRPLKPPCRHLAAWEVVQTSPYGRYCCKSPRGAARPGKFGNNRIRIAGSVNQNSRFDLRARKLFFVPASKIVLQQYRPTSADLRGAPKSSAYLRYYRRADRGALSQAEILSRPARA